ncbi:probable carboxylesterase 1 [Brassica napus]|uniref:probable carboxylesterase 1 n=1 Tax=Brassica napus TaxID=3708 RepID=UPI0006AACCD7|nr:probable carboxylesterase 1 [Brassica napus]
MDSDQELAYDYSPRFRIYKNGQIQRLVAETFVPPSPTPQNGVVSKDAVYSPEKNLSLRIYLPHQTLETSEENNKKKKKLPLLVYFHGGAFIMETAFSPAYNTFLTSTVSAAGCIAFSVDYRRSPEHPIPIPYEDSWDAVKWILTHIAGSGPEDWVNDHADFRRVFVAGDSAGANIAHHMAIRAGEENGSIKISGMTLFHPFFFSKAILEEQEDGVRRYMEGIWEIACPNSEKGVEDPWINVVGSDLSGLECGRVLVMVAGKDVLAREGRVYAEKLEECGWGGRVEVVETEGEDHVFHIRNPDSDNARLLVQRFAEFIRQVCCDDNVRK